LTVHAADEEITPEELISRHLESIGPDEARQQIATRRYIGEGIWRMLVGGVGQVAGQVSFVSSSDTCDFNFDGGDSQSFFGEQFGFNGKKTHVKRAFQRAHSVLGQFMARNSQIMREGLLGGTASLSWALRDTAARRAKVKYLGLKDIDGRQLHGLDYRPRKRKGDLKIELYFDPETYRHVRTEYRERFPAKIGPGRDPNLVTVPGAPPDRGLSMMEESQVSFIETFDNFQPADGVMVPVVWKMKLDIYSEGRGDGSANISEIDVAFQRVHHNEPIDGASIESR
jgi:hypothetical protein